MALMKISNICILCESHWLQTFKSFKIRSVLVIQNWLCRCFCRCYIFCVRKYQANLKDLTGTAHCIIRSTHQTSFSAGKKNIWYLTFKHHWSLRSKFLDDNPPQRWYQEITCERTVALVIKHIMICRRAWQALNYVLFQTERGWSQSGVCCNDAWCV